MPGSTNRFIQLWRNRFNDALGALNQAESEDMNDEGLAAKNPLGSYGRTATG